MAQNYGNAYPPQTYPQQAPPHHGYGQQPNSYAQPSQAYGQQQYAPPPQQQQRQQQYAPPPQQQQQQQQQPAQYQSPPPQNAMNQQPTPSQAPDNTPLTPEEQAQLDLLRKYAHILPLRMFPLDIYNHAKDEAYRAELLAEIQKNQRPALSPANKIALHAVGAATGTTFITMDGMVNGIMKGALFLDKLSARETQHVELSRWASPPGSSCAPIVVDVWEEATVGREDGMAMFTVRVNRDATIKIVDKKKNAEKIRTEKCKKTKGWNKYVYVRLRDMYVTGEAGGDVKLEKVLVTMKVMNSSESYQMREQFKKHWIMP